MVARGLGHLSLPIAIIPHPVGSTDPKLVAGKGIDIAAECIRMLTTTSDELEQEIRTAKLPLPPATVPK